MKFFLITISLWCIMACAFNTTVKTGDTILIKLKLTDKHGKTIDESGYLKKDMPLLVLVGNNEVFKIIDNALPRMKLYEEKKLIIPPHAGFGSKGVFYLTNQMDSVYVVNPTDTLFATIKVIKINDRH